MPCLACSSTSISEKPLIWSHERTHFERQAVPVSGKVEAFPLFGDLAKSEATLDIGDLNKIVRFLWLRLKLRNPLSHFQNPRSAMGTEVDILGVWQWQVIFGPTLSADYGYDNDHHSIDNNSGDDADHYDYIQQPDIFA